MTKLTWKVRFAFGIVSLFVGSIPAFALLPQIVTCTVDKVMNSPEDGPVGFKPIVAGKKSVSFQLIISNVESKNATALAKGIFAIGTPTSLHLLRSEEGVVWARSEYTGNGEFLIQLTRKGDKPLKVYLYRLYDRSGDSSTSDYTYSGTCD